MAHKKHTKTGKKTSKSSRPKVAVAVAKPIATPEQPITKQRTRLVSGWQLSQRAVTLLWRHKKLFIGIILIYGVLDLLFVKGFSGGVDTSSVLGGKVASSLAVFTLLVGSAAGGSGATAGVYQSVLLLVVSLAIIWGLRQVIAGASVRIRDTYYQGMYPLVPSVLVLLVVAVQLLPLVIGLGLYSTVISNGIAVTGLEQLIFGIIALALTLGSLYMISSSLFALYIVTLPDMTPLRALRSARGLVRNRRWTVLRKVLFLPLALLVAGAIIMLPIIIVITPAAQWIFFVLALLALPAAHAYMYSLYRSLLNE